MNIDNFTKKSIEIDKNDEGYIDEVKGYHDLGMGWNPLGIWCGGCLKLSCKGCINANKTKMVCDE